MSYEVGVSGLRVFLGDQTCTSLDPGFLEIKLQPAQKVDSVDIGLNTRFLGSIRNMKGAAESTRQQERLKRETFFCLF